jgi:hypothetical protein
MDNVKYKIYVTENQGSLSPIFHASSQSNS